MAQSGRAGPGARVAPGGSPAATYSLAEHHVCRSLRSCRNPTHVKSTQSFAISYVKHCASYEASRDPAKIEGIKLRCRDRKSCPASDDASSVKSVQIPSH